jgi:hypothetical protein
VLTWLETCQTSQYEDGLQKQEHQPPKRLNFVLHLQGHQRQDSIFGFLGVPVENVDRVYEVISELDEAEDAQLKQEADQVGD